MSEVARGRRIRTPPKNTPNNAQSVGHPFWEVCVKVIRACDETVLVLNPGVEKNAVKYFCTAEEAVLVLVANLKVDL